jgi:hypothetical protein
MAALRLVKSRPSRRRRSVEAERAALLPVVRGLKILQRRRPGIFNHTARGIAFMLSTGGREAQALSRMILDTYPHLPPDMDKWRR